MEQIWNKYGTNMEQIWNKYKTNMEQTRFLNHFFFFVINKIIFFVVSF